MSQNIFKIRNNFFDIVRLNVFTFIWIVGKKEDKPGSVAGRYFPFRGHVCHRVGGMYAYPACKIYHGYIYTYHSCYYYYAPNYYCYYFWITSMRGCTMKYILKYAKFMGAHKYAFSRSNGILVFTYNVPYLQRKLI